MLLYTKVSKDIMDQIDTNAAKRCGMTLEQYRQFLKDESGNWCKCGGKTPAVFHRDGEMNTEHCTQKHHWHCADCKKLVQVG